ncbi:MAG: hypothetical protein WC364_15065 [Eubacteriales bacterium]|jgi:hypothetical protein
MSETKGEMLVNGMDKIKEGLEMISGLGDRQELIKTLVGSQAAANRLKDLLKSNTIFENMVISMVASRNSRLNAETTRKVITDFLDVLFDLSQPYRTEKEEEIAPWDKEE